MIVNFQVGIIIAMNLNLLKKYQKYFKLISKITNDDTDTCNQARKH